MRGKFLLSALNELCDEVLLSFIIELLNLICEDWRESNEYKLKGGLVIEEVWVYFEMLVKLIRILLLESFQFLHVLIEDISREESQCR